MKRSLVLLAAIIMVVLIAATASAKWTTVGTSNSGKWIIHDKRITPDVGDCATVLVGLIYKTIRTTRWGDMWGKKRIITICCAAKTYQVKKVIIVNPQQQEVHSYDVNAPAKPVRPGSIADKILKYVCSRGVGAQ